MLIDRDKAIAGKTCWDGDGSVKMQDVLDLLYERVDFDTHTLLSDIAVRVRALPPAGVPDEVSELKERIVELERDLELAYHAMQYPND